MKSVKLAATLIALSATPALAHNGDHGATSFANIIPKIMHWLSSPTHSLFAVIGGLVIAAVIVKISRKRA